MSASDDDVHFSKKTATLSFFFSYFCIKLRQTIAMKRKAYQIKTFFARMSHIMTQHDAIFAFQMQNIS